MKNGIFYNRVLLIRGFTNPFWGPKGEELFR